MCLHIPSIYTNTCSGNRITNISIFTKSGFRHRGCWRGAHRTQLQSCGFCISGQVPEFCASSSREVAGRCLPQAFSSCRIGHRVESMFAQKCARFEILNFTCTYWEPFGGQGVQVPFCWLPCHPPGVWPGSSCQHVLPAWPWSAHWQGAGGIWPSRLCWFQAPGRQGGPNLHPQGSPTKWEQPSALVLHQRGLLSQAFLILSHPQPIGELLGILSRRIRIL